MSRKEIKLRCVILGCDGDIKYNGFGNFRCRKCDIEFRINHIPNCKHFFEGRNTLDENDNPIKIDTCMYCGKEKNEVD